MSRALVVALHGRCLLLSYIGPDVEYELENVGHEYFLEGLADGTWVWSGKIRSWTSYEGEHDYDLDGEQRPITKDEWDAWVTFEESPWDETYEDYYTDQEPCPVHKKVRCR